VARYPWLHYPTERSRARRPTWIDHAASDSRPAVSGVELIERGVRGRRGFRFAAEARGLRRVARWSAGLPGAGGPSPGGARRAPAGAGAAGPGAEAAELARQLTERRREEARCAGRPVGREFWRTAAEVDGPQHRLPARSAALGLESAPAVAPFLSSQRERLVPAGRRTRAYLCYRQTRFGVPQSTEKTHMTFPPRKVRCAASVD